MVHRDVHRSVPDRALPQSRLQQARHPQEKADTRRHLRGDLRPADVVQHLQLPVRGMVGHAYLQRRVPEAASRVLAGNLSDHLLLCRRLPQRVRTAVAHTHARGAARRIDLCVHGVQLVPQLRRRLQDRLLRLLVRLHALCAGGAALYAYQPHQVRQLEARSKAGAVEGLRSRAGHLSVLLHL